MNMTTHPQPLRNILKLEKGKPPLQAPYNGPGSERYLTPDFLRGKAAPEYARPSSTAIRVTDGDVIILWDGSNAGEVLRARDGMLASTMMKVTHNSDYDTGYFYYALKSWEDYLKGQTSGSGIPHVDKDILGDLSIFNCKKPEQTKIDEILSTVDQAIDQTEALIAKQQRIKTGLMQDLLTRGIDENGNLRSENTHEFKDSSLGRIPVEWEVKRLGTALRDAGGFLQTGPFGSQLHAHEYVQEGVPVIMPKDILFGEIYKEQIAQVPEVKANELRRHRVQKNDIVFSRRGDLTRAAAISERERGWICGTGCFLLRVPVNEIDSGWLTDVYQHYQVQRQIDINAVGSTMPSLNNGVMEQLIIAFPSIEEQREITRRRDASDAVLKMFVSQLSKLRLLKTALMQDLLTGKVSVTPLLTEAEISI